MKNLRYLFILLIGFSTRSVSQTTDRLPCIDKKFSIVAHVVEDSLGFRAYTPIDIQKDVDSLNKNFAPICVSFEVCEIRYIENFLYLDVDTADNWKEMQVLYNAKNRINVYFVRSVTTGSGFAGLGKITEMNENGLVIGAIGEKTLSHEMGHYFGLEHTFEDKHGEELVDGSNCLTAGDSICDTPADPNGTVDLACKFISMEKDANGQYYVPLVNNIMSYYPATCICNPGFTREQYKKMAYTYLGKKGMW